MCLLCFLARFDPTVYLLKWQESYVEFAKRKQECSRKLGVMTAPYATPPVQHILNYSLIFVQCYISDMANTVVFVDKLWTRCHEHLFHSYHANLQLGSIRNTETDSRVNTYQLKDFQNTCSRFNIIKTFTYFDHIYHARFVVSRKNNKKLINTRT